MRSNNSELLFSQRDLGAWLEEQRRRAVEEIRGLPPDEVLARPPQQVADEVIERYEVPEPRLHLDEMTGQVDDQQVDVAADFRRAIFDRSGPVHIDGSRITLQVPYDGPLEALKLRASKFTMSPPRASVGSGRISVHRDVPADTLERDRDKIVEGLHREVREIDKYLRYARNDIRTSNELLREEMPRAAEARRKKVLADRDTEAILGVPLSRDNSAARSYRVKPVKRKRITPARRAPSDPFTPEPAITDEDFADIVGDVIAITRSFERLAVTYADMDEERLRDQILAMLGNVYGPATGESFSKRGKSDIYLPWEGADPVFLAECKWWTGPKAFTERDLPQLLDRYVVWRDTHAAMILFIRNKDATAAINKAIEIIRNHDRYLRDAGTIEGAPVFILHKDGDPDREIMLALVTAAIHN